MIDRVPRFVVLRHATPPGHRQGLHWDLMLEHEGRLLTWALDQCPEPGKAISATQLPDHRIFYLDYEGPVSADRGEVAQVDAGEFEWLLHDAERIVVMLRGNRQSQAELERIRDTTWQIRFS